MATAAYKICDRNHWYTNTLEDQELILKNWLEPDDLYIPVCNNPYISHSINTTLDKHQSCTERLIWLTHISSMFDYPEQIRTSLLLVLLRPHRAHQLWRFHLEMIHHITIILFVAMRRYTKWQTLSTNLTVGIDTWKPLVDTLHLLKHEI